ncbi:glutaminyl-peptide cyclotransferase [Robertkochia aurantiaca]|uniref:glutaminyl-peptide cyclotransferase n=1 Tax=Robertkochia aurantiaca TaxID=2873700 RepID=UPI001CD01CA1|nr:glutaminyl-peptide cyclotransferase [Robertkochia sp. 3YJGBD-33]
MHLNKPLIASFIASVLLSCNGAPSSEKNLFSLETGLKNNRIQSGEPFKVSLGNPGNKPVEKISYYFMGQQLMPEQDSLSLSPEKLGEHTLEAEIITDGDTVRIAEPITILAKNSPKVYTYSIVNEFPHDRNAYTQGLEFHNGVLFESTGRRGQSTLRKTDFKTGEVLEEIPLEDQYFGEGITIMNGKIYQLTWQKKTGFIYDLETLERKGSFQYGQSKEGWGLTNDGTKIYKSDGSDKIWILDPETLKETDFIQSVTNTSVFNKANELEYVDGLIYANVWLKDSAMIIDARSGAIIGVIDFRGLKDKVAQHDDLDVLNGIAYHPERKTFFVTGKNWNKMFEVTISEK